MKPQLVELGEMQILVNRTEVVLLSVCGEGGGFLTEDK